MEGWIKLHRKLVNWEWYDDANTFRLFLHLLLKANHKNKKYRGEELKAGTVLTSREKLAIELGLTVRQIRTALNKLKTTNEVTVNSSRKGTVIQIVKYKDYQIIEGKRPEKRPANDQQTTSINNDKKEKNINERIQDFKKELVPFVDKYGKGMIKEFFLYWTEPNKSGTKFRKELQKTWSTERRLQTWSRNNFSGHDIPQQSESIEEREQRLKESKQN
jgi:hypothetical protein